MTIDEALEGVAVLGLDTAPLIYFVEQHPVYVDIMRAIIQRIDQGRIAAVSSVVTLTEVLTMPIRLSNQHLENEYRDLLTHSKNFVLQPIDSTIAEVAAGLRARYHLRTPDALQIAAALATGCQAFLTNDTHIKRVHDIRVIVLDDLKP
jgi:predicted nucleic acid-binding protein